MIMEYSKKDLVNRISELEKDISILLEHKELLYYVSKNYDVSDSEKKMVFDYVKKSWFACCGEKFVIGTFYRFIKNQKDLKEKDNKKC